MKSKNLKYLFTFSSLLMLIWAISCSGRPGNINKISKAEMAIKADNPESKLITMKSPEENADFKAGEKIGIAIANSDTDHQPDSVTISFDGKTAASLRAAPWNFTVPSSLTKSTGRKSIKATAYLGGRARTTVTRFIVVLSDMAPKHYTYKVINTYPHDKNAFTQGLFYNDGVLYEGTGEENSSLRKVDLESGKVLQQLNIASSLFGEGITLYDNRIYQVTFIKTDA